ncbi:MAG: VOC family protein [Myxococcota bacterium]
MERVQGIGGIFFKAADPKALGAWYKANLGLDIESWGGSVIRWADQADAANAYSVWSPFAEDTKYFEPSKSSFMINFRVRDLDAMLAQLRAAGCDVQDGLEDSEQGRFGWVVDPEGNKIELWQPPEGA